MVMSLHRQLQEDVNAVRCFVQDPDWVSLGAQEKQELEEAAGRFQERLDAAQGASLWAGFLGGTGVGKSSLMNALAQAEVATTSHRRPHTDRVLIYHHARIELPAFVHQSQVTWKEHVHQAQAVHNIILCDLPDFDSLQAENKEAVLDFMSHLDLLVWVTSPEKYADQSMYAALEEAPKAVDNFFFVLNKMDKLWSSSRAEESLEQMQRIAEHFRGLLIQQLSRARDSSSRVSPRLFTVSAVEQPPYSPWNQLELFRDALFSQRSDKQVAAIKAANLEQEAAVLYRPLRREKERLEQCLAAVQGLQEKMHSESQAWHRDGQRILEAWVHSRVEPVLSRQGPGMGPLWGPARLVGEAVRQWSVRGKAKDQVLCPDIHNEPSLQGLYSRMDNLKDRLSAHALRRNVPQFLRTEVEGAADVSQLWERAVSSWSGAVSRALTWEGPVKWTGLRMKQGGVYSLLTLLLLLGLGGGKAWMALIGQPGLREALMVFFSVLEGLFSPIGVAALVSYGLLMLGAGARFYRSLDQRMQDWAREYGRRISVELTEIWDEQLREVEQDMEGIRQQLDQRLQSVNAILSSRE